MSSWSHDLHSGKNGYLRSKLEAHLNIDEGTAGSLLRDHGGGTGGHGTQVSTRRICDFLNANANVISEEMRKCEEIRGNPD